MTDPEKLPREMTSELPCNPQPCNPQDEWRESLRCALLGADEDEPQICRGID